MTRKKHLKKNDTMSGEADSDWSVFPVGHEVIQDLDANDDADKTDLTGWVASEDFDDLDHNHIEQDGADFVIDDLSGNKLRLESVNLAALDENEFEVWLEQVKDLRDPTVEVSTKSLPVSGAPCGAQEISSTAIRPSPRCRGQGGVLSEVCAGDEPSDASGGSICAKMKSRSCRCAFVLTACYNLPAAVLVADRAAVLCQRRQVLGLAPGHLTGHRGRAGRDVYRAVASLRHALG